MASCCKVLIIIAIIFSAVFVNVFDQADAAGGCEKGGNINTCLKAIEVELGKVRQQSSQVQVILGQAKESHPEASHALDSCVSEFGNANSQLRVTREDLELGEASLNINYALDAVKRCETTLAQQKVNVTAVSDGIQEWKGLYNTLDVIVTQGESVYGKPPIL